MLPHYSFKTAASHLHFQSFPTFHSRSISKTSLRINKMADNKTTTVPEEEAKKADSVTDTTQAQADDKKTEDTPKSDSTSQPRPTRHLPTHYKGMPKQWEKNQVPKNDT